MKPLVVLVVDDNPDDRRVVTRHLTRGAPGQYRIVEASSGPDALALADEQRPSVVLLDQHLGRMEGIELLTKLRERGHQDAAYVMLTGSGSANAEEVLTQGSDDYVRKEDVTRGYLIRVVSNALIKARMRRQLREREEFEERLFGIVAHDLRSPLSVMTSAAELLRTEPLSGDGQRAVEMLGRSAEQMTRMVQQLLDLSRVRGAEGYPLRLEPLDVGELVGKTVRDLQAAHADRDLDVQRVGDARALADAQALRQVVSNLVGNALRYGAAERPVRVRVEGEDDAVALSVSNDGPSIDAEHLGRLFEPFHRGRRRGRGGLGLGLYIVRTIAEAHGGRVVVRSEENRTAFTVVLPRGAAQGSGG